MAPSGSGLVPRLEVICLAGERGDRTGTDSVPDMICPIRHPSTSGLGALIAFGPKNDDTPYTSEDRAFAAEYCRHLSGLPGVDPRIEERQVARDMYDRLDHPSFDHRSLHHGKPVGIPGLEYGGRCWRAGGLGGDFFDLIPRQDRELAVAIGNVAAQGTPGTLMLGGAMAAFRALAGCGEDVPRIAAELNRMMWEIAPEGAYSSFFGACIDPEGKHLRYVNAGHEAPLLVRGKTGRTERLDTTGAVLGLSRKSTYPVRTVAFEPGDLLIAFTDGIAEAAAPLRIVRLVRESPSAGVQDLANRILDTTREESEAAGDQTIVLVRARDAGELGVSWETTPLKAISCSMAA